MAWSRHKSFWAKVKSSGECLIWTASKNDKGYGLVRINKVLRLAHRVAYESVIGPIDRGLVIDHLCCTPACVNPSHLEPVTISENTRRGRAVEHLTSVQKAKIHCPQGHPYSGLNSRGHRICHTCKNEAQKRWEGKLYAPLVA